MISGDDVVLKSAGDRVAPCCLKYGVGRCQENFDQKQRQRLQVATAKLNSLVNFRQLESCSFLMPWHPLFVLSYDGMHRLLLMIAKSMAPQTPVFLDCEVVGGSAPDGLPEAGCLVQINLAGSPRMRVPADLTKECSANGNGSMKIRSVRYECVTLQTLKVLRVDDDISENLRPDKAKAKARDREFDLVKDWDKLKPATKQRRTSLGKRRRSRTPAPVETEQARAEDDLCAGRSGDDAPTAPDEIASLFDGDTASEDDPDGGDVAAGALREIGEAEREMMELPTWMPESFQVVDRHSSQVLGRIKPIHPSTSKEAISIYCRLHQCQPPLRRLATAPTNRQILRWFHAGQRDCPAGRSGQVEHLRLFKSMCAHTPGEAS